MMPSRSSADLVAMPSELTQTHQRERKTYTETGKSICPTTTIIILREVKLARDPVAYPPEKPVTAQSQRQLQLQPEGRQRSNVHV